MKGKISFDFDGNEEYEMLTKMYARYLAVDDALDHIRAMIKYTDLSEDVVMHLEKVRSILLEQEYV